MVPGSTMATFSLSAAETGENTAVKIKAVANKHTITRFIFFNIFLSSLLNIELFL
jgi:hypothetical protein